MGLGEASEAKGRPVMDSQGLGDAGLGSTPRSLSRGVARLWGEGCVCGSFRI